MKLIIKIIIPAFCLFSAAGAAENPAEIIGLEQMEPKPITQHLSMNISTQFYDWENDDDSSDRGYQSVTPITIAYQLGNFDFGYRQAYIISERKTPGSRGRVATISDAAFSASYTFKDWSWPLRLVLDYNLPVGKASLSSRENNVLGVDSYLVQQSQFGEGHNVTPGINITRTLSKHTAVGVGIGYTYKGKFDPNTEVANDVIDPGDETNITAQWQYRRPNWDLSGGVIYTHYRPTKRDGMDFFQKGERLQYNLTSVWAFRQGYQFDLSFRFTEQGLDKNFSGSRGELEREQFNVNGDTSYFALAWSKLFAQRHRLRLAGDYLKAEENDYPGDSINFNAGRSRFGYGATYSYAFSPRSSVSLTARGFNVKNEPEFGEGSTTYKGLNTSMNLNHRF